MTIPKKVLKIIGGVVVFFTLPTLLLYVFMYFKYNEALPIGPEGEAADELASQMLNSLNFEAYKSTTYIEFTFKKRHHFKWDRAQNSCEVYWKNYRVDLDLNRHQLSKAYEGDKKIEGEDAQELIDNALKLFNNDSFWLVAPFKVFDPGTERRLIQTKHQEDALLVTYTNGGSTPGDSYLWHFNASGQPEYFQMWVSILPIDGLEASWSDWTTTDTGAQLPTFHQFLAFGFEIDAIKTTRDSMN